MKFKPFSKTKPFKLDAVGYLDRVNRGFRVYFIRSRIKTIDGANIVLHESFHSDEREARLAYQEKATTFKLKHEFSNIQPLEQQRQVNEWPPTL